MKVPLSCTAELGTYLAPLARYSIDFVENSFVYAHPWVSFRPCTPHWNFLLIFNIFSRSCIWTQIQFVTSMYDGKWYIIFIFRQNFYLFSQPQYLKLRVRLKANIYFSKKYFPHSLHFFDSRLSFFAELWLYMWCVFVMAVHSATVLNLLLLLA